MSEAVATAHLWVAVLLDHLTLVALVRRDAVLLILVVVIVCLAHLLVFVLVLVLLKSTSTARPGLVALGGPLVLLGVGVLLVVKVLLAG